MKKTPLQKILIYICVVSMFFIDPALAYDKNFFSKNDILFYNPDACTVMSGAGTNAFSSIQGSDNAEKIFVFLTTTAFSGFNNKPFNAIQAAGALGNFQQESAMNPAAIEGGVEGSSPGDGHGLAQWSYNTQGGKRTGPGRRGVLMDLAQAKNLPWSDINLQLAMIANEINGGYGASLLSAGFGNVTSPRDASFIFQKIYEGAGIPNQAVRDSAAEAYYQKFSSLAPTTSTTSASTSTTGTTNSCTSSSGVSASGSSGTAGGVVQDNAIIYLQCDPLWAKIPYGTTGKTTCSSGCGPAAMAMIITALTGNKVTPAQTVPYASQLGMYVAGQGSSHQLPAVLAPHWGLNARPLSNSVAAVNSTLASGGMVIMAGSGSAPYSSSGHYIAVRAVTPDGKWLIFDSISLQNSRTAWNPASIMAPARGIYAVSK